MAVKPAFSKMRTYKKRNVDRITTMVNEVQEHKAKGIASYLGEETTRRLEKNIENSIYRRPNRGGYERSNQFLHTPARSATRRFGTNIFYSSVLFSDHDFWSSTSQRWYQHASMFGSQKWGYQRGDSVNLEHFVIWMEKGYNFTLKTKGGKMKMYRPAGNFIRDTKKWLAEKQSSLADRIVDERTIANLGRAVVTIDSLVRDDYVEDDDYGDFSDFSGEEGGDE